jgi:hypothetical protein
MYNNKSEWISGALVIMSIINVPLFLVAIFILQTKFRPEMQEDSYYYRYLKDKMGSKSNSSANPDANSQVQRQIEDIEKNIELTIKDIKKEKRGGVKKLQTNLTEIISMAGISIKLNERLDEFGLIKETFEKSNIIIKEFFGIGLKDKPKNLNIVIGKGFKRDQLIKILTILLKVGDGYIMYSPGDDTYGQYDNNMLIGAYGDNYKVKISDALNMLKRKVTKEEFYDYILEKDNYWLKN